MKTARKAGLKPKDSSRKQKYILPTPPPSRRTMTLEGSQPQKERPSSLVFDEELAGEPRREIGFSCLLFLHFPLFLFEPPPLFFRKGGHFHDLYLFIVQRLLMCKLFKVFFQLFFRNTNRYFYRM